jgi:hypothetical protein
MSSSSRRCVREESLIKDVRFGKETKMKKLGVLLVVLAICLPSYGTILVYKTTLKSSPVAFRDNESVGWETGSGSAKAYMVIDVNLADPNVDDIQSALIPYGKGDANGITKKVYVNDAVLDIFAFSILPGLELSPTKIKPDVFVIDLTADNVAAEQVGIGIEDARMQGTTKSTETSPGVKENVVTSFKGVAIDGSLFDDTLVGLGTFNATLDSKLTKQANDPLTFDGVFSDVVQGIKLLLGDQGYVAVTQTP